VAAEVQEATEQVHFLLLIKITQLWWVMVESLQANQMLVAQTAEIHLRSV
jgi:hypothetical protein